MLNPALIAISAVVLFIIIIWSIHTLTKLREVHQHNAKLESELVQTNEKNNLLSNQPSKNTTTT